MVLKVEPREKSLKRTVGASPTMVAKRLVSVVVVFVYSFGVVLYVFVFLVGFYEKVRVEDFFGSQRNSYFLSFGSLGDNIIYELICSGIY